MPDHPPAPRPDEAPSRRWFLLAGASLLAGCASTSTTRTRNRPGLDWPDAHKSPDPVYQQQVQRRVSTPRPSAYDPERRLPPQPAPTPKQIASQREALDAIPRSTWAERAAIPSRLRSMSGVSRITVHHEGWTPVWFDSVDDTADRLESIRRGHLDRMRAGDIGYHYIIDRAGRLWAGRDLRYQGAHVRQNNPHNIGVMVLGNFDQQSPADAQLDRLDRVLIALMHKYKVPVRHVYTHQELVATACPGEQLQPYLVDARRSGKLT